MKEIIKKAKATKLKKSLSSNTNIYVFVYSWMYGNLFFVFIVNKFEINTCDLTPDYTKCKTKRKINYYLR